MMRALAKLVRSTCGTMAIETALIAPVLVTMALGAFEASNIVLRQQQLQSGANEASEIILAAAGGSGINSADLEDILEASLDLTDEQLQIAARYRCDTNADLVAVRPDEDDCGEDKHIASYVRLTLTDTYTPVWTEFGIGKPISYNTVRHVQVS